MVASTHLSGLQYVALGDSVTEFGNIPNWVGQRTGMEVYKCGFGGTRLSYHLDADYDAISGSRLIEASRTGQWNAAAVAVENLARVGDNNRVALAAIRSVHLGGKRPPLEATVITLAYGSNDFTGNVPIGQNSDTSYTTFKGAINYVLQRLMFNFPNAKVMLVTPTWRMVGGFEGDDSDTVPNGNGNYLIEYADAMIALGALNHVPVLDLYRNSGINRHNARAMLADGTHPTPNGYNHLGHIYSSKILATF